MALSAGTILVYPQKIPHDFAQCRLQTHGEITDVPTSCALNFTETSAEMRAQEL